MFQNNRFFFQTTDDNTEDDAEKKETKNINAIAFVYSGIISGYIHT